MAQPGHKSRRCPRASTDVPDADREEAQSASSGANLVFLYQFEVDLRTRFVLYSQDPLMAVRELK